MSRHNEMHGLQSTLPLSRGLLLLKTRWCHACAR